MLSKDDSKHMELLLLLTYALTTKYIVCCIYENEPSAYRRERVQVARNKVHNDDEKKSRPLKTNNNWMRIEAESVPLLHFEQFLHRSCHIFLC